MTCYANTSNPTKILNKQSKTRTKLLTSTTVALVLMLTAGIAQAQTTETSEEDIIYVEGTSAIAATKTLTPLSKIPQSISVITMNEIFERTAQDLQDVYRYSAGVSPALSVDARGDFINARGFSATQYLDGMQRQPSFIYGARLDTYTLERAEILRGPSSVLYGAGGPGGVLNGASKTPNQEFGGEIGVDFGNDNRFQVRGDITGSISENFAGRLVALGRTAESQWGTPDDRLLVNPSLTWFAGPDTKVTVIGLYQDNQQASLGYLPLQNSLLAPTEAAKISHDFYQGEPGFNGMDTQYTSGTLLVDHDFSSNLRVKSATRYAKMDTDYKEIFPFAVFSDVAETQWVRAYFVNDEQSDVLTSDTNVGYDFSTGSIEHSILVGLDYTWFEQDTKQGFGAVNDLDIFNPNYGTPVNALYNFAPVLFSSKQLGLYAQDQITIGDRLNVVLGIRHDKATSDRDGAEQYDLTAVSLRGGVIYEIIDGISPYLSYAESFTPVAGGDFFGNPYVPQEARQYEAGVKWVPFGGALLSFAYFDIEETNYISQDPTNIQNFLQGGSVGSKGVEVEATIRIPGDLTLTAAYSYTDAQVTVASTTLAKGDRIAGMPEQQASLWAVKSFELDKGWSIRAGGGVRYIGSQINTAQTFFTPDVTLVDGTFSLTKGNLKFSINASNLFNKEYYAICDIVGASPNGYCIPANNRTFVAGVTRKF
ncbi:MAG: hypothetical protein COB36_12610 [Alphaproteobacteria bacterium]|nr:MAG: hypothetical protein COB36_12610 [Alphaproteobacteria bacterium]